MASTDESKTQTDVDELIALSRSNLEDDDWRVCRDAVVALGKIDDLRVVEPLIKALEDDGGGVYLTAQESLVMIGGPAVEPLIKALDDKDKDVRTLAALALGWIGDERAVEPLIKALEDEDKDVRRDAADALGEIGDERAVEPLIKVLSISHPVKMSGMPIRIKPAGGKKVVRRDVIVVPDVEPEPLINTHGDEDMKVRLAAADTLIGIGEPAVVPLINALKYGDLQAHVVNVLNRIGKPAVEPLIKALGDEDKNVRQYAAYALGEIGDEGAVEPLEKATDDEDKNVRLAAVRALGMIGAGRAVFRLTSATKDKDSGVRRSAAIALGDIFDRSRLKRYIRSVLTKAKEDEDKNVRSAAASTLGKIDESVIKASDEST